MNIESLRSLCLSFPGATESIKWGQDLCFSVGEKMFCVSSADADNGTSFKVTEAEFDAMTDREGIIPAPYLARHKWVLVHDFSRLSDAEWQFYVGQSYELVKENLPKKIRETL